MEQKAWYTSKTLWVNAIMIVGGFVAPKLGVTITPEIQITVLGVINMILRVVTKHEVTFT